MIPKVIHYCWFGGAPKPKSVLQCINSWKKQCPDFEIREWTEKDFDVTQNEYTRQAYEARAWGFVPDYIRLWIIYNNGGIYLDTDVQILKSFEPLLQHKAYAGFEDSKHVNFGQGFGAEKGNPFIYAHMRMYEDLRFVNEDGSFNKTPSPLYTTQCLVKHGLQQGVKEIQELEDITIYPAEYFCPRDLHTGITTVTEHTYSIHQFDASWYSGEDQEKKKERWEQVRRQGRKEYWKYLPNRIMLKLLGEARYEKVKGMFKKG